MALECTQIQEWIEEQVSQPVEEWEEHQEQQCKDYPWYDPRGWVCWIVTSFVKVVRWILVTVGKWVTRTVCTLTGVLIDLVEDVIGGLWDIIAGLVTFDWRRILDGLLRLGIGIVLGVIRLLRVVLLGDTIQFIIDEINRARLRDYVLGLLEAKYSGDTLEEIEDAIRLNHGAFGLRLKATANRTFLDSETPSPQEPGVPNLVVLHESGQINLRALCGFAFPDGFWNRKRYKTLKKGIHAGGGGGEPENPISEDELNTYLGSRGTDGPAFVVLCMRDGVLDDKISTAEEKGRQLAVMLDFDTTTVEVTTPEHIIHHGYDLDAEPAQARFLIEVVGRADRTVDDAAAVEQLCHPVTVGVFGYTDTLRGLTVNIRASKCGLDANKASGVTFIDNIPDAIWKYVPIHELGHYFGLCHVDGVDHIMFSPKTNSWWRGWSLPRGLLNVYLQGEPSFFFDEAKQAWAYIVANFDAQCLGAKEAPPPIGLV